MDNGRPRRDAAVRGAGGVVPPRLRPDDPSDILIAMVLVLVGTFAALVLPEGNTPRLLLALPVLFFAPGYLLIQAALGHRSTRSARGWHAALAVGVSPPVIGILALLTAAVPGGFRMTPIILSVTVGSVGLALLALYRRTAFQATPAAQNRKSGTQRARRTRQGV